jgi:uncharacterized protein YeaO (DUF488 family)
VNRPCPRDVSESQANIDQWRTENVPSTTLRKWFEDVPTRWVKFRQLYFMELEAQGEALDELHRLAQNLPLSTPAVNGEFDIPCG